MYLLAIAAQGMAGLAFAMGGVSGNIEFAVLPIQVAAAIAAGRRWMSVALIGATVIGAFLGQALSRPIAASLGVHMAWPVWFVVLFDGCAAALGLIIGYGMVRRWTYGRVVAMASGLAMTGIVLAAVWAWPQWLERAALAYQDAVSLKFAEQQGENGEIATRMFQWLLLEHWGDVGLGMVFCWVVLMFCFCVSMTARWVQTRLPGQGIQGGFSQMRPPEWLVWAAILAVGLWYADVRWPEWGLRPFVWNTAVALALIYWLNGTAIALFAFRIWQLPTIVVLALFLVLMAYAGRLLPLSIGLFDTWFDFRRKLEIWKAARDQARNSGGDA